MAQFPDVYRPWLPRSTSTLAVYQSVQQEINAIIVGQQLAQIAGHDFRHQSASNTRSVRFALDYRNKLLPYFPAADQVRLIVNEYAGIELDVVATMVSAMMGALGAKGEEGALSEMLGGFIELLKGDASTLGMWRPLSVTPTTLAQACRKLIATSKFVPKPVELAEACREARYQMVCSLNYCRELCDFVVMCDAALLKFELGQWCEPYLLPQYQSTGRRMLELHSCDDDEDLVALVEQTLWSIPSLDWKSDLSELPKS